jgi:hypothetical protein
MTTGHEFTIGTSRVGVSLSNDGAQASVWTVCTHTNGSEYLRTIKYGRLWNCAYKLALADRPS